MDFGSGKSVNAGFPEKKTGQFSGGPGGNPREPFCLLLGLGPKEGGRAFDIFFYSIAFFLRGQAVFAHIMRLCHKAQSVLWHPLSFRKERGERSVRGLYPLNPQVACRLSFQESRREGGYPNPPIYKKGAAAPYKYSADSGNRGMSTYDV